MNLKRFYLPLLFMVLCFHVKAQPELDLQPFASGLENPIGITNAGDERLFVIQQRGLIQIIYSNGAISDSPFLDLSDIVSQSYSERGLLGPCLPPRLWWKWLLLCKLYPEQREHGYLPLFGEWNQSGACRQGKRNNTIDHRATIRKSQRGSTAFRFRRIPYWRKWYYTNKSRS